MEDGIPGDYMGFLLSGKLAVKKATNFPGKYILLAILEPGAIVGEISAVGDCPQVATVVAIEKSELLVLTCEELENILSNDTPLGVVVLKRIIHVISLRQQKSNDRLSKLL
ncbi:MAG: cyclic nucleotide-binding domain-containing protein [Proteobacteria bacterium]|nr:cyclic nucleotide-binding domain-containing protein [Pseudomonadota bacterium]MBU1716849.1 cyclic nucleotide-binding domain-containing protein [Pseudomonadota bacterium]